MSSTRLMSNILCTIVLCLMIAVVTLSLISPTCCIAQNTEIICGEDNCKRLWLDDLPSTITGVKLGKKQVSDLSDLDICKLLVIPIVSRKEESVDEWCNCISVDRTRQAANTGDKVISLNYDYAKIPKTAEDDLRFYVPKIFADKLRFYIPCYVTHSMTNREDGGKPRMHYKQDFYFDMFPQHKLLLRCSYELSGWAANDPILEYKKFPYQAKPFGVAPNEKYHRAAVLADISSVRNGKEILQILVQHADNYKERACICRRVGEVCWAPRRIKLPKHQYASEVIAFCEHQMVNGELFLPSRCAYFAIRLRQTNDYLIEALVSPNTFYPSGNGLGDADIVCKRISSEHLDSIIKCKYSAEKGYSIAEGAQTKVVRKGQMSEVYTNYRENLIILLKKTSDDKIVMTPMIYFSTQNVRSQDQYRPISDIEYDYYSNKIIERMKPELECYKIKN